jgi:serine/threonine-protein kinase HipA
MRRAHVYFRDRLAGELVELDRGHGYRFTYAPHYIEDGQPISLTLPLRAEPFESPDLFPFFGGLVPEGWYLSIVAPTLKVDEEDTFGLLLHTCRDCIGAVSLVAADAEASDD